MHEFIGFFVSGTMASLSWIGNAFILLSIWLVGKQLPIGWLFGIAGNALWCAYAICNQSYDVLFLCGAVLIISAYNCWLWLQNEYN
jgi:nicotinamide riboside transporter PnuC